MKERIVVNGKTYELVEELTVEDCVSGNRWLVTSNGVNYFTSMRSSLRPDIYPTEAIAEKVLLYGLLQSVAHKLNGGNKGTYTMRWMNDKIEIFDILKGFSDVTFATKELAEEAIRIFQASKFDLKKLFQ